MMAPDGEKLQWVEAELEQVVRALLWSEDKSPGMARTVIDASAARLSAMLDVVHTIRR